MTKTINLQAEAAARWAANAGAWAARAAAKATAKAAAWAEEAAAKVGENNEY